MTLTTTNASPMHKEEWLECRDAAVEILRALYIEPDQAVWQIANPGGNADDSTVRARIDLLSALTEIGLVQWSQVELNGAPKPDGTKTTITEFVASVSPPGVGWLKVQESDS